MAEEFEWPWEYSFPPFFTLQIHDETRKKQVEKWGDLILKFQKHFNKFIVNINDKTSPLFYNESIKRRLSADTIQKIMQYLENTGHAVAIDKKNSEWQVYWYTLEEYANMVYEWVLSTGQMNTVCTLYEIANTENTNFNGIDEEVLLKALHLLEAKGKCELISNDDSYGVKFF